jgi:proline dehydrogenase
MTKHDIKKKMNEIHDEIRDIVTSQATRIAAEKAMTIFGISAISANIKTIIKEVIQISDDDEFHANNNDDADSDEV